jgi:hypothetical protein
MYGDMGKGLGGCLAVLAILAVVGIFALGAAAWWAWQRIDVQWSDPPPQQEAAQRGEGEGS